MGRTGQLLRFAFSAFVCAGCDQAAKGWVSAHVEQGVRNSYLAGFVQVVHVRNPGAAFGLLADVPLELRVTLFTAISALAAFVVLSMLRAQAPGERGSAGSALALGAILGGAASNLLDRVLPVRGGEVIDYLHVHLWGGYPWPDFNLADAAIVLGLVGLVVQLSAREGEARAIVVHDENDS